MYVDPSVLERDSVVFRAGRHSLSIAISTHALFRDDPAVITPLIAATAAAGADAG
jgi:prolyl-tRNA editing enzyme YbaK/EbsC (Cys-tRNA(Pro) deacylase)